MRRAALALALALTTAALQAADKPAKTKNAAKAPAIGSGVVLSLREGRKVAGSYQGRHHGAVWVGVDGGEIGVEESTILAITPSKTADSEFTRRKAALAPDDAGGWWKLAVWARDKDLATSARSAAETVVKIAPDHAAAREFLGHTRFGERWADFEESQRRKGFVEFEGEWLKEFEVRAIKAAREQNRNLNQKKKAQKRLDLYNANEAAKAPGNNPDPQPPPMGGTVDYMVVPKR